MDENIMLRREDVAGALRNRLKNIPVTVNEDEANILIMFQELLVCGIEVCPKTYRVFNVSREWQEETTCKCNAAADETYFYYVDSADEVISEIYRLVVFEATKNNSNTKIHEKRAEELRKYVTPEIFKEAYSRLIVQADQNAKTGNANGSHTPYGFKGNKVYGYKLEQNFGQGGASKTPYLYWHVVSIYYLPDNGRIVLGIEENRYAHMHEMQPKKYTKIGNKADRVAVFYETNKDSIDYYELYNAFMDVCDEVFRLGLEYLK